MSLGATKNPPSRRVFSCPEGNVGGRSRTIPLTLPYPQTPSLGEGAGGRSRLSRFAPNPPDCNADAVEVK